MKKLEILCGFLIVFAVQQSAQAEAPSPKAAKGFQVELWADGVKNARSMTLTPSGWLFVGTRSDDKVYAINSKSPSPRKVLVIAEGLNSPNGVAFKDGTLYVAEISRILAFENVELQINARKNPSEALKYRVAFDGYPKDGHHGWKFIRFGPDGKLYVPVGAPCNVCERKDPYASITRLDLEQKRFEIVARGVRNTVGFDWDSAGKLWFTDNGRDHMGDNRPPCEINRLEAVGADFGFPMCHGKDILDPKFGKAGDCAKTVAPVVELGAHTAPLGMRVLKLSTWPARYRGAIVFAEHGSWNRSSKVGYRVGLVPIKDGKVQPVEDLLSGFLDGQKTLGRPVDVEEMPDGSLLVSDDYGNRIWRISQGD